MVVKMDRVVCEKEVQQQVDGSRPQHLVNLVCSSSLCSLDSSMQLLATAGSFAQSSSPFVLKIQSNLVAAFYVESFRRRSIFALADCFSWCTLQQCVLQ